MNFTISFRERVTYSIGLFLCIVFSTTRLSAQCTCSGEDISITTSTSDPLVLADGDKACIQGGTFTGSVTMSGNSELCISSGATIEISSFEMSGTAARLINYGTFIYEPFPEDETITGCTPDLADQLKITGTFINNGSVDIDATYALLPGGVFTHQGTSFTTQCFDSGGTTTIQADLTVVSTMRIGEGDVVISNANVSLGSLTLFNFTSRPPSVLNVVNSVINILSTLTNDGTINGGTSDTDCGRINVGSMVNNSGSLAADNSHLDVCVDNGSGTTPSSSGSNYTNCTCTPQFLPITLRSFRGRVVQDPPGAVLLEWVTEQEINNEKFILQRSGDARIFQDVVEVAGAGTTLQSQVYKYLDQQALYGINYYRLKQVDFDGTSSLSSVIAIDTRDFAHAKLVLLQNPAERLLRLDTPGALPVPHEEFRVEIWDLVGRRRLAYQGNLHQVNESLAHFKTGAGSGVYVLRVFSNLHSGSFKLFFE